MSVEQLVAMLGGWPEYFGAAEIRHGESLLAHLRRERLIDEIAFGIVVRYAVHRAAYDRVSWAIAEARFDDPGENADASHHFLSAAEQERAYHRNSLERIEKQLLGTPYERAKAGRDVQTSFMDELMKGPATETREGGNVRTFPFAPISRPGRG